MPAVPSIFADFLEIPVVVEPICVSAGARRLMDAKWLNAVLLLLFPACLVVAPNSLDGRLLVLEAEARLRPW